MIRKNEEKHSEKIINEHYQLNKVSYTVSE